MISSFYTRLNHFFVTVKIAWGGLHFGEDRSCTFDALPTDQFQLWLFSINGWAIWSVRNSHPGLFSFSLFRLRYFADTFPGQSNCGFPLLKSVQEFLIQSFAKAYPWLFDAAHWRLGWLYRSQSRRHYQNSSWPTSTKFTSERSTWSVPNHNAI